MGPETGPNRLRGRRSRGLGVVARLRHRDDEGMTLVEVLVTIALITAVVVPLGVFFTDSMNVSAANAGRQDAAMVATSVLSHLDALAYDDVGFTATTTGGAVSQEASYAKSSGTTYDWTPNVDSATSSEQLAIVGTDPSFVVGSSATPFAPIMSGVVSGGTVYRVETHVVEVPGTMQACNGGTTSIPDAYRRAFVEVSWHNGGIGHETLYQDKLIYPGGLSPAHTTTTPPVVPGSVTATPRSVTGEVTVSWTLPDGWTPSTSCFKVGWANYEQNQYSTTFLPASDSGPCPSSGTALPTAFTTNDSRATYCVTGLTQGGATQAYTFYVTAYSPDGTASSESGEATANAPLGPTITAESAASQTVTSGTQVTLTGTDFSTVNQPFEFCAVTSNCTSTFTPNCASTADKYCEIVNCTSTTSCTVPMPTPLSTATVGVYYVIAETVTTPEITSPPQSGSQVTYTPIITSATSAPSGKETVIDGQDLFPNFTTFEFNGVSVSGSTDVQCGPGGTSCTVTVPNDAGGNPFPSGPGTVYAVDNGVYSNAAPNFTY